MTTWEPPVTPPAPAPAAYSIGDALGYGWRKFSDNAGRIIGYGVLLALPILALYGLIIGIFISNSTTTTDPITGTTTSTMNMSAGTGIILTIAYVAVVVLALLVTIGVVRATVRILDGQAFGLGDLVSFDRVGTAIVTSILTTLGTLVGLILCILPGIAFAFLANYSVWFVIDKKQSPVTAIKSSIAMVRANLGNAILLTLVVIAVSIAGELACGVGLFVALPVTYIAMGYSYRKFSGEDVVA